MSENFFRRELKRLGFEFLCVLMLLQSSPLMAMPRGSIDLPPVPTANAHALASDAQSWVSTIAGQPWRDALTVLLASGAVGDQVEPPGGGAPPLPPAFESSRSSADELLGLRAVASKSALEQISLVAGWNLVSLPEEPADTAPGTVLAPIAGAYEAAYSYDGCDSADPWKVYDPNDPGSSDLSAIDARTGLWLQATTPVDLPSEGTLPTSTTFDLCVGWNLISFPAGQARPVESVLAPIAGKYLRVFGYDAFDPVDPWEVFDVTVPLWANDLVLMQPGRAYWILVTEATPLEIANEDGPPEAILHSPTEAATLTDFTTVVATARSKILDHWSLRYRLFGDRGPWTEFARGVTSASNEGIATFDPTLLRNGMYDLQLLVTDLEGRTSIAEVAILLDGQQKIGEVRLDFLDLEAEVGTLPLQVVRSYDSRDKRLGDFGFGWRLSLTDVALYENGSPGDNWQGTVSDGPFPNYCIEPSLPHIVAVSFPDGEVYRFQPKLEPRCQLLAPPQVVTVSFEPLPGTRASLGFQGVPSEVLVEGGFPGPVQLFDTDNTTLIDPTLYELTLRDGTSFLVRDDTGLVSLTEPNGNSLTFSDNGIVHSNGPTLEFIRDGQGRITEITDLLGESLTYQYDTAGDLVAVTDQLDQTTQFVYQDNHHLHKIIDPDGREVLAVDYDDDGRLIRVCNNGQQCQQAQHDLTGKVETVIDATGRKTVYTYDDRGNVLTVSDDLDHTYRFEYDDVNLMTKHIDPTGAVTEFEYNSPGDLITVIQPHEVGEDPADFTLRIEYNGAGDRTKVTLPSGGELHYQYDSSGNLEEMRDENGNVLIGYDFDVAGNETLESVPGGSLGFSDFDAFGNPQTFTDDVTGTSQATYDDAGRLVEDVEGGVTSTFSYDKLGRELTDDFGDGEVLRFEYGSGPQWTALEHPTLGRIERDISANGRLTGMRVPGGLELSLGHDAAGRVTRYEVLGGAKREFVYDEAGRQTVIRDGTNAETQFGYDAANRVVEVRDAEDNVTQMTYRPNGEPESLRDPNGELWQLEHTPTSTTGIDPLGRRNTTHFTTHGLPARTEFADGNSVEVDFLLTHPTVDAQDFPTRLQDEGGRERFITYDANLNIETATDLAGETYTYEHDALERLSLITGPTGQTLGFLNDEDGRVTEITYGDGGVEKLGYGDRSEIVHRERPSGLTVGLGYDLLDRLTSRVPSSGPAESFTYDPLGGLVTAVGANGTTQYDVDEEGRPTRIDFPDGSAVVYGRDKIGRVTAMEVHDTAGGSVHQTLYGYDDNSNLTSIEDPLGGLTTLSYDVVNRLEERSLPNGVTSSWTYDMRDRITSVVHKNAADEVLASVTYTRLASGEPERIDYGDGAWVELDYDPAFRLAEERHFSSAGVLEETLTYTYDAAGNRITHGDGAGSETWTYLDGHRLNTITGPNGTETYGFDADGRMASVVRGGTSRALTYDFKDRLTAVHDDGQLVASYTYDAEDRRVSAAGPNARSFVVAPSLDGMEWPQLVRDAGGSLAAAWVYQGDEPLLRHGPDGPIYYLTDAMGSVIALADDMGSQVAHFRYDGFGGLREQSGTASDLPALAGGDFRFQGGWLESSTGLYNFRAREYDPRLGTFLSRDPFGPVLTHPERSHPYLFANANPHVFRDPTGLFGLPSVSVASAVRGILGGIKANFMRTLYRRLLREAKEFGVDLLVNAAANAFLEGVGMNKILAPFGKKRASVFEASVLRTFCDIFGQYVSGVVWFEVKVKKTGKTIDNGFQCPLPKDQAGLDALGKLATKGPQVPRPDLFLSNKKPTKIKKKIPFQSFVIGDVKISVYYAYRTWRSKQVNQRNAIRNHAKYYGTSVALLVAAFSAKRKTCKNLRRLFWGKKGEHRVWLVIFSLSGQLSKRKTGC